MGRVHEEEVASELGLPTAGSSCSVAVLVVPTYSGRCVWRRQSSAELGNGSADHHGRCARAPDRVRWCLDLASTVEVLAVSEVTTDFPGPHVSAIRIPCFHKMSHMWC